MFSKLTCIEREAGRKAGGRRAGAPRALMNVSVDDLGAVIKILSRWEVNRKDLKETQAPSLPPRLGKLLSPCLFLFYPFLGWIRREFQKGPS